MNEVRLISPQGMLGYGFPVESFVSGIQKHPHAIVVDAGSTDAGPHKLGAGVGIVSKKAAKRDLGIMLKYAQKLKIPVIVGSAGGSGGRNHIQWTVDIVEEIARENSWNLKVAIIDATIDKTWLKEQLAVGRVTGLAGVPELTQQAIDETTEIVAQMGYEPYLEALNRNVDIVIAGRSYDPAMTVAACVRFGMTDIGLAYHMGKILECGALCAVPGSAKDCIMGYMREDGFIVESLNPERRCTTTSVAAHTLYEKTHPYLLPGPGGVTDLSECGFEQLTPQSVKITGSRFIPSERYTVKLEGAKCDGYRSVLIAGLRDPRAVACVDEIIAYGREQLSDSFSDLPTDSYFLDFKIYGRDGVMGEWEPVKQSQAHELCMVVEVVAESQEIANTLCAYLRSSMLHYHYEGRKATAGNLAFPFAPSEFPAGPCYKFSVYHLLEVDSAGQLFPTTYQTLG